jgi:GNAT superfamily N-acetyltransferase
MLDDWFRTVRLNLTIDEFHRLPRAAGYKHEYFGDQAVLTPRPRNGYAALDLGRFRPLEADAEELRDVTVRPIADGDWELLGPLCGGAFHRVPPFSTLGDDERSAAGADCMAYVRRGGDGPVVREASVVATDAKDGKPWGALLVVMKPPGYRDDPWRRSGRRRGNTADAGEANTGGDEEADVAAAVPAGGEGQPHVDWVFVSPCVAGRGLASTLLARTVDVLRAAGHACLTSSFMIGNGESMAWHWRNGFELLTYPGSMRQWRRHLRSSI